MSCHSHKHRFSWGHSHKHRFSWVTYLNIGSHRVTHINIGSHGVTHINIGSHGVTHINIGSHGVTAGFTVFELETHFILEKCYFAEPPRDTGGSDITKYQLEMDDGRGKEICTCILSICSL